MIMSPRRISACLLRGAWVALLLVAGGCARLDADAELAAAAASLAAGRYGEAGIRLDNLVQAQPDNFQARRRRGELALVFGDYRRAVEEFNRARRNGAPLDSIAATPNRRPR